MINIYVVRIQKIYHEVEDETKKSQASFSDYSSLIQDSAEDENRII